jgi:hypothetical protein
MEEQRGSHMNEVQDVLICDSCKAHVMRHAAQFHFNENDGTLAWDHRVVSGGNCLHYSPMRNADRAPVESSARYANWLNLHGSARHLSVLDIDGFIGYHVKSVHDLLWVAANVIAPAGYEPSVTLSKTDPRLSTILSGVPLGISGDGSDVEYHFLRLCVGNWLLVSRGPEQVMRRVEDVHLRQMLNDAGMGETDFKQSVRSLDVR